MIRRGQGASTAKILWEDYKKMDETVGESSLVPANEKCRETACKRHSSGKQKGDVRRQGRTPKQTKPC